MARWQGGALVARMATARKAGGRRRRGILRGELREHFWWAERIGGLDGQFFCVHFYFSKKGNHEVGTRSALKSPNPLFSDNFHVRVVPQRILREFLKKYFFLGHFCDFVLPEVLSSQLSRSLFASNA